MANDHGIGTNINKHTGRGDKNDIEITKEPLSKTMQKKMFQVNRNSWESCHYCPATNFEIVTDFIKHLQERHCTREGGSYVCRYGFNGVCPSLPLDGVSDRDYDAHVKKYHVNQQLREMAPQWSLYSASQNLPAVLNDPSRGKQSDLFTKDWGGYFMEKPLINPSYLLRDVWLKDFDKYSITIIRRCRRRERFLMNQNAHQQGEEHLMLSGTSSTNTQINQVPDIFFKETLNLQEPHIFAKVFPKIMQTSDGEQRRQTGRLLQEQLSHYLDVIEVKIAQQVSQKSAAFFRAMTSQDAITNEMEEAIKQVRALRRGLSTLHDSVITSAFRIISLGQRRQNFEQVLDKLRLMATVHKTQPMLQLLLGTQDYVAALDLIGTTQEVLAQELIGVHCFKHLPMQLAEMEKLIDKMLITEFERYATTGLNRPLSDFRENDENATHLGMEGDKLVCILMGLLRKKNFSFIDTFREEAIVTVRTIKKQLMIEFYSISDMEVCLTGMGEEGTLHLSVDECLTLLGKLTVALLVVLQRIKAVVDVMKQTTNVAAGEYVFDNKTNHVNAESTINWIDSDSDVFLTKPEREHIHQKLNELLTTVCLYCQELCANLVSSQSSDNAVATVEELTRLSSLVEEFTDGCQHIHEMSSVPLRVAVQVQSSRFASKFHSEHKEKLTFLLDAERWVQVDVPKTFQKIIDHLTVSSFSGLPKLMSEQEDDSSAPQVNPVLLVESEPYALVGSVLLLTQMICEYCCCARNLPIVASHLSRNVIDLLRLFNARSCQLVMCGGALHVAGLKTITSTNLALLRRALQLVLWLLPKVKQHFQSLDSSATASYDTIEKDFCGHINEIENKICNIMNDCMSTQLNNWDARPPIPSISFRNISRDLVKLHAAIASILCEQQIRKIYSVVHRNFKDKLKEQLIKLNIVNNGGPQHGAVTSELIFYMQTLRTLKVLPEAELNDSILENIWDH